VNQISYANLLTLCGVRPLTAFKANLAVIPDFGCRLFISHDGQTKAVMTDEGEPFFFPSVDAGIRALSSIPGIDHHINVDAVSLMAHPRKGWVRRVANETLRLARLAA